MEIGTTEVDTPWVPDFDEVDFDNDGCTGFTPNIITPTEQKSMLQLNMPLVGGRLLRMK